MLSVVGIKSLRPKDRPYKVADSDGLFLLVQPSGALLWRYRYKILCQERKLSLGAFPKITLAEARKKRDAVRAQLEDGIDPVEQKRQRQLAAEQSAQTTFALVATEYIDKMRAEGKSPATLKKAEWFLELLEPIAKRPIDDGTILILAPDAKLSSSNRSGRRHVTVTSGLARITVPRPGAPMSIANGPTTVNLLPGSTIDIDARPRSMNWTLRAGRPSTPNWLNQGKAHSPLMRLLQTCSYARGKDERLCCWTVGKVRFQEVGPG
ncbi:Arm DNA-binding domain-containing protein [Sphingomonas sp. BGYR3]|uniref:Arm DNA-binding domain-containing protein n=1 Tax=Sphingomonas sp. BGYR3 TaxID=2975483 RepID=UPI0021A59602|nr:Arm DNA-binding domain-containing protein [Sphingomonas sp. BGYR3]MDG5487750.1 Arm DNA-binding domain-containing protein [Sphingomonas sp. BGYR3]